MIDPEILALAAERAGLTPEQIGAALAAVRYVGEQIHAEPEWAPVCHMTMTDGAVASWGAEGTAVTKQIETARTATGWGRGVVYFIFRGDDYETYGEARAAELRAAQDGGKVVSISEATTP